MLKSQKLQLEMSEKRRAINEMSQSDDYKVEELDALNKEYMNLEVQYSAALITEDEEQKATPTDDLDSQAKEVRGLEHKLSVAKYVTAAMQGTILDGVEAEYQSAKGFTGAGIHMPIEALLKAKERVEMYAATSAPATAEVNQAEILSRIFATGDGEYLGVRKPGVAVGAHNYPVLTNGVDPETVAKGAPGDKTAAVLTPNVLEPKSIRAQYEVAYEDTFKLRMMEEELRADITEAISEAMDKEIVADFITNLTDPTNPTAVATFADYASARGSLVDGRYAKSRSDVRVLVGSNTYAHADSLFHNGATQSAADRLDPMVSPHIPAPASDIQKAVAVRSMGRAVAPMWPTINLIRDDVTGADEGKIFLNAIAMWNFKILDVMAYRLLEFKLA